MSPKPKPVQFAHVLVTDHNHDFLGGFFRTRYTECLEIQECVLQQGHWRVVLIRLCWCVDKGSFILNGVSHANAVQFTTKQNQHFSAEHI
ncbi:hypothetical protein RB195_018796 [Necator americanus]|uniref:TLDc domain-containing protein n=1 Tax=Necator americanus TaxID=51031 RepID=A0ABR1CBA7_NECAM